MTPDVDLDSAVRNAMLHCAQSRVSFDAAKIAAMLCVPLAPAIEQSIERWFWIGLLAHVGYRRHARTGASVLFNVHSGDIAGTLGYAPPEDPRPPEQMPTDWIIEVHTGQLPTGVLFRDGERAAFDNKRWGGPDFAIGSRVIAGWKRSPCGWFNIVDTLGSAVPKPEVVLPQGFTLEAWLAAFSSTSGKLKRMSAKTLLASAKSHGQLDDWETDEEEQAERFTAVLSTIAFVSAHDYDHRRHAGLLLSCIWLDDGVDESMEELHRMLGLRGKPDLESTESYPPFDRYLAACNRLAAREGLEERVYRVDDADDYLVIKLAPAVFEALVAKRLLFAHVPKD
ncbi:MAG TPA: hypothetical protein VLT33_06535 [Labilithrix sp.]|nr:hypothetical protein [Labilithrix sp.]